MTSLDSLVPDWLHHFFRIQSLVRVPGSRYLLLLRFGNSGLTCKIIMISEGGGNKAKEEKYNSCTTTTTTATTTTTTITTIITFIGIPVTTTVTTTLFP
ncbi:hypothetical protein E2C01_044459 [Portunus trituberculatus]|uniref:Uncharacterized protein n=1 Tax=Portunus trituberculatus TaxID=210409 RepID=A0A5B7FS86_PORTR|nr:hypothetical protein [Portunus trituberculatus]